MTNQMRKLIRFVLVVTLFTNIVFATVLLIPPIGFVSSISYFLFGFNAITTVTFFFIVIADNNREKLLANKIKKAKRMQEVQDRILMDFYTSNNIPPQYDKQGKLRTLDSLLGIVPQYDNNGRALPTIYDLLNIKPVFDEQGKEVPSVIVIKHLVSSIDKENQNNLKGIVFIRKPEEHEIFPEESEVAKIVTKAKKKEETAKKAKKEKKKSSKLPKYIPISIRSFAPLKPGGRPKGLSNVKGGEEKEDGLSTNPSGNIIITPQERPQSVNTTTNPQSGTEAIPASYNRIIDEPIVDPPKTDTSEEELQWE